MGSADTAPEVLTGQIVGGKWRILGPIGRGGMGAVYEGQNVAIGKRVALKFIDAEFARHPEIATRFQREAEAASLVDSAHIVQIFDSGTTESGLPYIVMELLRGEDLRARLRRLGRLGPEEAAHVIAQTLRGLHRAHEAGIVHRDLKPDNIFLVDRDDDPSFAKIVDFGISKVSRRPGREEHATLTRQGVVMGTPLYMSPEQAQALPDLDLRADLWSVGAILFECLVGKAPHGGDAYEQIIVSICTTDAPDIRSSDPGLSSALATFVRKALQRDKTRRFQSAREMLDGLVQTGALRPSAHGTPPPLSPAVEARATGQSAESDATRTTDVARPGDGSTRVSFSQVVPATLVDPGAPTDVQNARAEGMRKRGLVLLGVSVTLGAFILTLGLLRASRRSHQEGTTVEGAETSSAPLTPSARAEPASASPDLPHPSPSSTVHSPSTYAPALAPASAVMPAVAAPGRSPKPAPLASPVLPAVAAPIAPSAAKPVPSPVKEPPRSGVAAGLQIKTNYP